MDHRGPYSSILRKRAFYPSEGHRINTIKRGKPRAGSQYRALSEDIDLLADRPESCVGLQAQGELMKAVLGAREFSRAPGGEEANSAPTKAS
jgi:hypothetical protein